MAISDTEVDPELEEGQAKKVEIRVVVIAHVRKLNTSRTRKGQEVPPVMEDLKDSNSLAQVPAVVAMLHRRGPSEAELRALHSQAELGNE